VKDPITRGALKGSITVGVGLRISADSQPLCHFSLCSAPPWASVGLSKLFKASWLYTSLRFLQYDPATLDGLQQRPWSVLNFPMGGASASILITLRSLSVITTRPIEADDSAFRTLGRNAILFVCFWEKTLDLTVTVMPFQTLSSWNWLGRALLSFLEK